MIRYTRMGIVAVALLSAAVAGAQDDKRPTGETYQQLLDRLGDGMRENLVIRGEHDSRTDARKHKRFYTDLQPLADLPAYRPAEQLSGTIRVSGLYLHDGLIKDQWVAAFQGFHPKVKVVILPKGTIASGAVDIETGPRISDRLRAASQYELATGERLFEIDWATGSYDVPGWSPGFVIYVHQDNPLTHLSVSQLDGIFAGARTGGWKGTTWDRSAARGPEKNIRTWGQLGLTGEWADKPIAIYGRPLKYNIQLGFERKVFDGGDMWNENTREYSHEANADGTRYSSSVEMVKDLTKDRYGISFSDMGSNRPGVRAVPLGATAAGPFVPISLQSLRDRSYPLFVEQWAQVRLAPGKRLTPLVKAFLKFMLSRDGQDGVQRDGKWITLPAPRAAEMRRKLDAVGERVDPHALGLQLAQLAPRKWDGDSPDETGRTPASKAFYTQRFDLSGLPRYTPERPVAGVIRMPASGQLTTGTAGRALIAAFTRQHPGISFDLKDGDLIDGAVDLSIGRKWSSYFAGEFYDFQLKHDRSPREIQVATGSFDVPGWSPAFAIYVARDNPLKGLTIRQLDGIFGGPRRGGWVSTTWRRQAGRSADANIRFWRQLGVTGRCASRPITVYVPPLKYHLMSVFERKVLVGGNMWNDAAREIPLALDSTGARTQPGRDRVAAAVRDGCGIAFAEPGIGVAGARIVPVAHDATGPFVAPTLGTVQDRTYPLHLETYAYADAAPGQPLDPRVREFLRFVLSRDGQEIIQQDGKWLPLTAAVSRVEAAKLDRIVPQVTASSGDRP
ncbi:MAG: phosphate-binding protein [Sphingomonas bacterium]|uniref:PstS family phosphate ABC transporter substrate-binding protein n=1 Tax=Sphingomonas bacterium TaxID=1895847 RepID=UPI00261EE8E5|nr:substrate-binding domain-containing protein [Sphingomonas bacterium]MDB5694806.1 phosphate-binding protein [Sphingomonas bacterium]